MKNALDGVSLDEVFKKGTFKLNGRMITDRCRPWRENAKAGRPR